MKFIMQKEGYFIESSISDNIIRKLRICRQAFCADIAGF
jgi:hypothetical protein